ncbi:MAG: hypothetical protein ACI92S_001585, partial [Planctomycetaceae bacterium]
HCRNSAALVPAYEPLFPRVPSRVIARMVR